MSQKLPGFTGMALSGWKVINVIKVNIPDRNLCKFG